MSFEKPKSDQGLPVPTPGNQRAEQAAANDQSIQQVHAILLRENEEPSEGFSPMPLFFLGFISAMVFLSAVYIVHYRGDFDPLVYDYRYEGGGAAAGEKAELTPQQMVAAGKRHYQTCVACHQADGAGVAGVFPPLAGSEWVNGSEERVIRVLLHGLSGPVEVEGNTYNGLMPAFGKVTGGGYNWNNEKIAQVLSYVRQEWGNKGSPITTEKVTEILKAEAARSTQWTQEELAQFAK